VSNSCIGIINYSEESNYQLKITNETGYVTSIKLVTTANQMSDNISSEIFVYLGSKEFDLSKITSFKFKLDFIVGNVFYEVRHINKSDKYEFIEGSSNTILDTSDLYKKLMHLIFNTEK